MKIFHIPCLEDNYAYLWVFPISPQIRVWLIEICADFGEFRTPNVNWDVIVIASLIDRIVDEPTKEAAVVDPVEPEKVLEVAKQNGASVKMVLTTHHHW